MRKFVIGAVIVGILASIAAVTVVAQVRELKPKKLEVIPMLPAPESKKVKINTISDLRLIAFGEHQAYCFMQGKSPEDENVGAHFGSDFYKAHAMCGFLEKAKASSLCQDGIINFMDGYRRENVVIYQTFSVAVPLERGEAACNAYY